MPLLSHPSFAPKTAIWYITSGAILDVWTAVWYWLFLRPDPEPGRWHLFFVISLFFTGIVLIVLGLALGPIGRSARKAELPPAEATPAEARIQQQGVVPPGATPVQPGALAAPAAPGATAPPPRPVPPVTVSQ